MRIIPTALLGLAALAAATAPAAADELAAISGKYDVKFDEMASNCTPPPVALARGVLTIEIKKNSLTINTDLIPLMAGVPAKNGKVNAKTTKLVGTTVQGLSGRYSVAGRVDDNGVLQLVLVAEYINQLTNKPYCTQSWNVGGVRKSPDDADAGSGAGKKPAKK
jgi:hypothetical protein